LKEFNCTLEIFGPKYLGINSDEGIDYIVVYPINGIGYKSHYTAIFNSQFKLVSEFNFLHSNVDENTVHSLVIKNGEILLNEDFNLDSRNYTSRQKSLKQVSTESISSYFSNVLDCLEGLGIPNYLLGIAGAVCGAVCLVSGGTACPACLAAVLAGYATEITHCIVS